MAGISNHIDEGAGSSPLRRPHIAPSTTTSDGFEHSQPESLAGKPGVRTTISSAQPQRAETFSVRRRSSASTIQQFLLDTLLTLPAVCFLAYAIMALRSQGLPIDQEPVPALQTAAIYSPTVFPIAFAAVAANLLKSVAAWKMERGVSILSLEYLLSCRTVFSALTTPLSLRRANALAPLLIVLWALSPLGGQAALRIMDVVPSQVSEPWPFECLEFLSDFPYSAPRSSGGTSIRASIQGAFVTALSNPEDVKRQPRDLFGNVKIPMIEHYRRTAAEAHEGWYNISADGSDTVWSSIMGLPIATKDGLSSGHNYSFSLQTAYVNSDCSVKRGDSMDLAGWIDYMDATKMLLGGYATGKTLAIRPSGFHYRFTPTPMELIFTSYYAEEEATTNATCTLTMTHVEVDVACHGPVCGAHRIRQVEKPENMTVATVFDGIQPDPTALGPGYTFDAYMSTFIQSTLTTWDTEPNILPKPFSSPIETYFTNPYSPYSAPGLGSWSGTDLLPVGDVVFSQRFAQLLNTFWLAGIASLNITGNFNYEAHTANPEIETMRVWNTTGTRAPDQLVMRVNRPWMAILFIASLIMLLSGVAAGIFGCMRRGPDVLDRATFFLRDSPYVDVRNQSSLEDGTAQVKRSRGVRVCVGDVRPMEDTGYVALGTVGEAMPLSWQDKERRYA